MSNNYTNYQEMVTTTTTAIEQLAGQNGGISREYNLNKQADELENAGERLKKHIFSVGILGEFKRGKSTVINALLGQNIVPADILPCSATLNYIKWDACKRAEIKFKDGSIKEVPVEELTSYVSKLTEESAAMAETVEDATVYYPCTFCQNGVQIVDTPGLNDDERMTAITEKVLPTLDAIIMVIVPSSPFSQSEATFVRNKLMTSDLGKLIFLVNQIDIIDEEDVPRVLADIRSRIEKSVLEKMAEVHGKDSEEYRKAKATVGDIKIIPVSARNALRGKMKNDPEKVRESGFEEFEKVLSKILVEERGVLELLPPVNKTLAVAKETFDTINTRREALKLSAAEFENIQLEAAETLKEARENKRKEVLDLKSKGKNLYADLVCEADGVYNEIENKMTDFVESYPIDSSDVADNNKIQALSEKMSKDISNMMEGELAVGTERIVIKIKERLDKDLVNVGSFGAEVDSKLGAIREKICSSGRKKGGFVKDLAIDAGGVFFTGLPGLGGLIAGYREHGIKGALVGGIGGTVTGMIAAGVMGVIGATVTLPLALVLGTVAAFGGKKITQLIFGKKDRSAETIEKIRTASAESVKTAMSELRASKCIENWLKTTCETVYNNIAEEVDNEFEKSFEAMEETLSQIKTDIAMNAATKENNEKEMDESEKKINGIVDNIKPVKTKLEQYRTM